jgi:hypothetical protein
MTAMRKTLLLVLLLAAAVPAFSATNDRPTVRPREFNPFLAGTLSWYSAGLGQIYTGDYAKGAVFFAIDNTLLYMAINAIADINLVIDENIGLGVNVALRKDTENKKYRLNGAFFLVAFLTFHFYNVFDAVLTSTRKNSLLLEDRGGLPSASPPSVSSPRPDLIDMPLLRQRF